MTLMIWIGIAGTAIVIALMIWKARRRVPHGANSAAGLSRDVTFAGMLLSFAETVGLARASAAQRGDGNADSGYSWHGSHLDHGAHGGFSEGGGGYGGGDAGGGGI